MRHSDYWLLHCIGAQWHWGIAGEGAIVLKWFQHWGGRDLGSQIIIENSIFSEPIQSIHQVQMTTEKCRWRQKRTDLMLRYETQSQMLL